MRHGLSGKGSHREVTESPSGGDSSHSCFEEFFGVGLLVAVSQYPILAVENKNHTGRVAAIFRFSSAQIQPVIPSKANEDRNARPVEFDKDKYKRRSIVENVIGWMKESRRVFSRFEKTAKNFGGFVKMAFIHRYLRLMTT